MNRLPIELVNMILTFRPTHPTAKIINELVNELKADMELARSAFDEYFIAPTFDNFSIWSAIDAFDGEIDLKGKDWSRNWATKMLYHNREDDEDMDMPFIEEYELIKKEAIEEGYWTFREIRTDELIERLKKNNYL